MDIQNANLFHVEPFNVTVCVFLKDFAKEIKNDNCVICLENKPNIYFVQCGHKCVCNNCGEKIETERGRSKCPLCRCTNKITIKDI